MKPANVAQLRAVDARDVREAFKEHGRWRSQGRLLLWDVVRDAESAAYIARALAISPQRLSLILTGRHLPNVVLAARLGRVTQGRIPAEAWGLAPTNQVSLMADVGTEP